MTWLIKNVLPKVAKWASEVSVDGLVDDRGSMRLVDVTKYNEVYQRLKIKYGKPLVKVSSCLLLCVYCFLSNYDYYMIFFASVCWVVMIKKNKWALAGHTI